MDEHRTRHKVTTKKEMDKLIKGRKLETVMSSQRSNIIVPIPQNMAYVMLNTVKDSRVHYVEIVITEGRARLCIKEHFLKNQPLFLKIFGFGPFIAKPKPR